ncbi:MAG TPA: hypothetical protein V6C71_26665 [Coleofasciculaceae cyanobacterium]|jgi:hypothetical protein
MILIKLLLILSLSIVGNTVINLVTIKKQHLFHSTAIARFIGKNRL